MTVTDTTDRLRDLFANCMVYKAANRSRRFADLSIPPYLRDWLVMRFSDEDGEVNMDQVVEYVRTSIPDKAAWEAIKSRMVTDGETARFLAKIRIEVDVVSGKTLFGLPDLDLAPKRGVTLVDAQVVRKQREALYASPEPWGVVELEYRPSADDKGAVVMVGFRPFKPYVVDIDYYQEARRQFSLEEWLDVLLMGVDYSPVGFASTAEKLALLTRLLPFLEKRINLIELAPKGTGKSYMFSQLSKHGWLVSGGSITRARLFYNIRTHTEGLVNRNDYVAMDEVQTITFGNDDEVQGALKGYMESGEYRVGDHEGTGEAGIILLGNIKQEYMDVSQNMLRDLPTVFHESALIDRFHGFLRGWMIPRMNEDLKAEGWALNTEYLTEMFHALRDDIRYRGVVEQALEIPRGADTRDTEAVKRIATAYLKLLFPQVTSLDALDRDAFDRYCLQPALDMRGVIRKQLFALDDEFAPDMPDIKVAT